VYSTLNKLIFSLVVRAYLTEEKTMIMKECKNAI